MKCVFVSLLVLDGYAMAKYKNSTLKRFDGAGVVARVLEYRWFRAMRMLRRGSYKDNDEISKMHKGLAVARVYKIYVYSGSDYGARATWLSFPMESG